jgi:hypothetical protein
MTANLEAKVKETKPELLQSKLHLKNSKSMPKPLCFFKFLQKGHLPTLLAGQ